MKIELKVFSIPVDSVRVIGNWIVGCVKDLDVPPITKDTAVAVDLVNRLTRFSLSFPANASLITDETLFEFVNLPEHDVNAAANYIEGHGILAPEDLERQRLASLPKGVEEFWREAETTRLPFALRAATLYGVQRELRNLQKLSDAIRSRNLEIIDTCVSALELTPRSWKALSGDVARGRLILRESIQNGLRDVQFGVAELKSGLVPFFAPGYLKPALYLALLDQITREVAIGECENPRCQKIFDRTHPKKRFCSERCQALLKVHRFRNKSSKTRKNHKRKEQK